MSGVRVGGSDEPFGGIEPGRQRDCNAVLLFASACGGHCPRRNGFSCLGSDCAKSAAFLLWMRAWFRIDGMLGLSGISRQGATTSYFFRADHYRDTKLMVPHQVLGAKAEVVWAFIMKNGRLRPEPL